MHLLSTEESNNTKSTFYDYTWPDLLLRLLVLRATKPMRVRRLRKLSSDRLRKAAMCCGHSSRIGEATTAA